MRWSNASEQSSRRAGWSSRRAFAATLAALGLAVAAAAEDADTPGLETLMGHFAASRGVEAAFREEKRLPLLTAPLLSEGVLYYAPPGRLARLTTTPETTSLLVDGDRLRIEDGLGVEELDLASHREARQFIDQLMLLFRGDLAALERDYEASFEGEGEAWSLRLVPRSRSVRQLIREISLAGRGPRLDEMVVSGAEGEVTRTTYTRILVDRPFRAEELARIFPAAGSPAPLARPGPSAAPSPSR